jgi:hypothetical protein
MAMTCQYSKTRVLIPPHRLGQIGYATILPVLKLRHIGICVEHSAQGLPQRLQPGLKIAPLVDTLSVYGLANLL